MFEKFKEGNIITLKLASGEEVIAKFKSLNSDYISIEKALVLMQGPKGLAFGTFFSTADQNEPTNGNLIYYQSWFRSILTVPF